MKGVTSIAVMTVLGINVSLPTSPQSSNKIFTEMDTAVEILGNLANLLNNVPIPVTLTVVVVYTALTEVIPKFVTRHNSNAYTSQVLWNVTLKGLRFQIVNYYLYHQRLFAILVHGITILIDTFLWTMYFHHLLHNNPWWSFWFIYYMCILQTLTFDNVKLKITLVVLEGLIVASAGIAYHWYLEPHFSDKSLFGYSSLLLFLNAFARVISHMPEPLPIDYLGLHNELPVAGWYWKKTYLEYILYPPRLILSVFFGVISELQAGLPVRLLTSTLILIITRLGWTDVGLSMEEIRDRADQIDLKGWKTDQDGAALFAWEGEEDMQHMFKWAAKHRNLRREKEGQYNKTWLDEKDKLPLNIKLK